MLNFEFEEQMNRLSASLMKPSISEKAFGFLFKEVKGMNADIFKASIELMMKEGDRNFMPKLTELYKYYNLAKNNIQDDIARNSEDERKIPEYILNRADHEVAEEFERWKVFYEAYPYPDYPAGSTAAECEAIDKNYQEIMQRAGFDSEEVDPKANLLFIRDALDTMDANSMNLPETQRGQGWEDSLKNYHKGAEKKTTDQAKNVMCRDWF